MELLQEIAERIATATGGDFVYARHSSIGGGCINAAYRLEGKNESYFVKLNDANRVDMFAAEDAGLKAMSSTNTLHVPKPVCHGVAGNQSFIAMEYLEMGGGRDGSLLGEQLAQMHRHTSDNFGWIMENTIGSTPQMNEPDSDWVSFWQQQRLGYQLGLARKRGASSLVSQGEKLIERVPDFFKTYQPKPSLIHGDLWSGNYSFTASGEPTIFDPAVYYGDREAEIAMTELFGGFGSDFYSAYNDTWPLDEGYSVRKTLYNLYHIINHFNMFGGGYGSQAESMMGRLLSECI